MSFNLGRESAMFATAFFTSLLSNSATVGLKRSGVSDVGKKVQRCLSNKMQDLPVGDNQEQRASKYNALVRECEREVGAEKNTSEKTVNIIYYALLGGVGFTGILSGAPLFGVYYAFDKTDKRVRNGIIYAVLMTLINSLLLALGRPTTKYEVALFSLLYGYIAMVTSAFFHEFSN